MPDVIIQKHIEARSRKPLVISGKRTRRRAAGLLAVCAALLAAPLGRAQQDAKQERIRERTEQLRSGQAVTIGTASIAAVRLIPAFYERRDFRPAWTNAGNVEALLRQAKRIDEEGLDPQDYHLAEVERLIAQAGGRMPSDPVLAADLDILLTESAARIGYHLRFGKVNPEDLDPDWNLSRDLDGRDPVEVLQQAIESDSLDDFIEQAFARHPFHVRLKTALAEYREIQRGGGWPAVPDGPALKPGTEGDRVTLLRERLARTGDLAQDRPDDPRRFDEQVERAVIRFQRRHGLEADGIAGRQTLAAMNVPVQQRIDQIRLNLERARWVCRNLENDFIVTNIAGFRVLLVRDGKPVWTTRAQVGKPYRKTPVFRSTMKYLVFNPTWTVPPGILRKDMLPRIQRDPDYLRRSNINVIDREGQIIDASTLDWASYTGRNFPYMLRQDPGPNNALGRVKFIFPNQHFVFLHDTPSKQLFDRPDRTFSSGCIRVENPFELAELLLDNPAEWNRESFQRVLDSGKPRTVFLPTPLTVLLLYWTVETDDEGTIRFLNDVYDRDQRVLDGLNEDFVFRPPSELLESLEQGRPGL